MVIQTEDTKQSDSNCLQKPRRIAKWSSFFLWFNDESTGNPWLSRKERSQESDLQAMNKKMSQFPSHTYLRLRDDQPDSSWETSLPTKGNHRKNADVRFTPHSYICH